MNTILKLEEAAMTAIGIYLLTIYNLHLSFWLWAILFFSPDIGMLGYVVNTKIGAVSYNLFHHKGIAIALAVVGYYLQNDLMIAISILLFSHASFDRIMGYGLKYQDSFKNTHLGSLEKN
jgi:positive regulator of sigma E activity